MVNFHFCLLADKAESYQALVEISWDKTNPMAKRIVDKIKKTTN